MEGELFDALYRLVRQEATRQSRRTPRVRYSDAQVLLVFLWSVLHDRPRCWACRRANWPTALLDRLGCWDAPPSEATVSRRMRSYGVQSLLARVYHKRVYHNLAQRRARPTTLVRVIDAKPLPVGGFSKDRDARRGHGAGQQARGYKLFCIWGPAGLVPDVCLIGPMNLAEPTAAATLVERLVVDGTGGTGGTGYLLGDVPHDSNPLHATCAPRGFQLVAPRRSPGTGLGHQPHEPSRLRAIELLENPHASTFGRDLYAWRTDIEREFGHAGNFGGGLQPLPNWVRRPRRVVAWVIGKLLINAVFRLETQRVAA